MSDSQDLNATDPSGILRQVADRIAAIVARRPGLPRTSARAIQAVVEATLAELTRDPRGIIWVAVAARKRVESTLHLVDNVAQNLTDALNESVAPPPEER